MGLIDFFNDPNSAIIFGCGIIVSAVFIIGVTKSLYGPKKWYSWWCLSLWSSLQWFHSLQWPMQRSGQIKIFNTINVTQTMWNLNNLMDTRSLMSESTKDCMNCWSPIKGRNEKFCHRRCYNVWRWTQKRYKENPLLLKIYKR